jgi:hypothetical protein
MTAAVGPDVCDNNIKSHVTNVSASTVYYFFAL